MGAWREVVQKLDEEGRGGLKGEVVLGRVLVRFYSSIAVVV